MPTLYDIQNNNDIVIGALPLIDPKTTPGHARAVASVFDALSNAGRVCPAELRDVVDHCIRNSQIQNDTLVTKVNKDCANYYGIRKKRDLVTYIRDDPGFIEGTHYRNTSPTGMEVIGAGHLLLIYRKAPVAALEYIDALLRTIVSVKDKMQSAWNAANPAAAEVAQITSADHVETGHLIAVTHHECEALAQIAYGTMPGSGSRTGWVMARIGTAIFPKLNGEAGSGGFRAASARSGRDPYYRKDPVKRDIAHVAGNANLAFRATKSFSPTGARHALVARDLVNLRIADAAPDIAAQPDLAGKKRRLNDAAKQGTDVISSMYAGVSDQKKRALFFPSTQQGWDAIGHGTSTVNTKRAKHQHGSPQTQDAVTQAQARVTHLLQLPAP